MKPKLLVLDDEPSVLDLFQDAFSDEFEILRQSDPAAALNNLKTEHPNVAIFDICLPGRSGLSVLREAKNIDRSLMVIMTTGHATTQNAIEAMKYGAYDYITKPFSIPSLRSTIQKALECNLLNRKVRYTKEREQTVPDGEEDVMIGSSPEMIEIWKMVGTAAASDATVLIQGESGTGKELLARAIYNNSRRKNRNFLAVNCAALPENLLESELFGHEKGAFTDAHSRKIGKFEQCNGGTIFLDEIGEMSLANQGKLLRAIENQEFQRVGGNENIKVDVRIIAATNRSLVAAVKEKTFRMDLFYRLKVVSFFLPRLRERVEDIPLLADLFIRKYSARYDKTIKGLTPAALDLLMHCPWEGNIRELQNVINSAVVFSKSDFLAPEDFQDVLRAPTCSVPKGKDGFGDDYHLFLKSVLEPEFDNMCRRQHGAVYELLVEGLEKATIGLALAKTGNNQVLAAKLLGVSRNTLRDRIDRYTLHAPSGS